MHDITLANMMQFLNRASALFLGVTIGLKSLILFGCYVPRIPEDVVLTSTWLWVAKVVMRVRWTIILTPSENYLIIVNVVGVVTGSSAALNGGYESWDHSFQTSSFCLLCDSLVGVWGIAIPWLVLAAALCLLIVNYNMMFGL